MSARNPRRSVDINAASKPIFQLTYLRRSPSPPTTRYDVHRKRPTPAFLRNSVRAPGYLAVSSLQTALPDVWVPAPRSRPRASCAPCPYPLAKTCSPRPTTDPQCCDATPWRAARASSRARPPSPARDVASSRTSRGTSPAPLPALWLRFFLRPRVSRLESRLQLWP